MQDILSKAHDFELLTHRKARSYYLASKSSDNYHNKLGVPVVIASTIVGTAIFSSLNDEIDFLWLKILTGFISLSAAVLAALQTFFKFSEMAEKHHTSATKYDELESAFVSFIFRYSSDDIAIDRKMALADFDSLVSTYHKIQSESLDLPDRFYDQAVEEQKSKKKG